MKKILSNYGIIILIFCIYSLYYYFTRENFVVKIIEITIITITVIAFIFYKEQKKSN
jgi:multisubunit Na+/H+ antiporter MnhC subunit